MRRASEKKILFLNYYFLYGFLQLKYGASGTIFLKKKTSMDFYSLNMEQAKQFFFSIDFYSLIFFYKLLFFSVDFC